MLLVIKQSACSSARQDCVSVDICLWSSNNRPAHRRARTARRLTDAPGDQTLGQLFGGPTQPHSPQSECSSGTPFLLICFHALFPCDSLSCSQIPLLLDLISRAASASTRPMRCCPLAIHQLLRQQAVAGAGICGWSKYYCLNFIYDCADHLLGISLPPGLSVIPFLVRF